MAMFTNADGDVRFGKIVGYAIGLIVIIVLFFGCYIG